MSSLYPLENGMAFAQYSGNKYNDIFDLYKKSNYYTVYMHGNEGSSDTQSLINSLFGSKLSIKFKSSICNVLYTFFLFQNEPSFPCIYTV